MKNVLMFIVFGLGILSSGCMNPLFRVFDFNIDTPTTTTPPPPPPSDWTIPNLSCPANYVAPSTHVENGYQEHIDQSGKVIINKKVKLVREWMKAIEYNCDNIVVKISRVEKISARDDVFLESFRGTNSFVRKMTVSSERTGSQIITGVREGETPKIWIDVAPNTFYGSFHVEDGLNVINIKVETCERPNPKDRSLCLDPWRITQQGILNLFIDYEETESGCEQEHHPSETSCQR